MFWVVPRRVVFNSRRLGTLCVFHPLTYQDGTDSVPKRRLLTLNLLMSYICGAPCKARNFNVMYIYGPAFGNAESRLFLFSARCFNTESMQKFILCHSCV
jgi:hypothetical protein